jgi:hypothetical protein
MANNEIQALIASFTAQIEAAAKRAALEQVLATLRGSAPAMKRGPGRPKGSAKAGKTAKNVDAGKMGESLLEFIKANPGQRSDQIAKALGTTPDGMRKSMTALMPRWTPQKRPVVDSSKAASPGGCLGRGAVYLIASVSCKLWSSFVRQLRGPHLMTCA